MDEDSDASELEYELTDKQFMTEDYLFPSSDEEDLDFSFGSDSTSARPKCSLESGCFCERLCLPQSVWHEGKLTELRILEPPKVCRNCLVSHPGCCLLLNGYCGNCEGKNLRKKPLVEKPGDKRWPLIPKVLKELRIGSLQTACQSVIFRELSDVEQVKQLPIAPLLQIQLKSQWESIDEANKEASEAAAERRRQMRRAAERDFPDHFRRHRIMRIRRRQPPAVPLPLPNVSP